MEHHALSQSAQKKLKPSVKSHNAITPEPYHRICHLLNMKEVPNDHQN